MVPVLLRVESNAPPIAIVLSEVLPAVVNKPQNSSSMTKEMLCFEETPQKALTLPSWPITSAEQSLTRRREKGLGVQGQNPEGSPPQWALKRMCSRQLRVTQGAGLSGSQEDVHHQSCPVHCSCCSDPHTCTSDTVNRGRTAPSP